MSTTTNEFSPEVRTRAVRLVLDHEVDHASRFAAISSMAAKIGCRLRFSARGPAIGRPLGKMFATRP